MALVTSPHKEERPLYIKCHCMGCNGVFVLHNAQVKAIPDVCVVSMFVVESIVGAEPPS